jgi:protein-disulfide isomerase
MHDALFGDRRKLGDDDFIRYAKDAGIDVETFKRDLAAPATRERVAAEMAQGQVLGVESTPTFFVNGRKITGAKDENALVQIIEEERAIASKLLAAGAKRNELYARFMHAAAPGAGVAKAAAAPAAPADEAKAKPEQRRGEASAAANYAIGIAPGRATRGPDDALVTIVAYVDYGCSDCQASLQRFETVLAMHPAVRAALRFGPITEAGRAAATAVAAAGLQGKLWEAHAAMVELGRAVDPATVRAKMQTLAVDMERLDADMKSDRVRAMLAEDLGVVEVVRGTAPAPLYFVNGRFLGTTANPSEFDTLITEETSKAEAFIASERITRAVAFEKMRETWRGYSLVEAVPKADPAAAAANKAGTLALGPTPVLGDRKRAKIEIVACSDFDCPACARGAKNLQTLRGKYGDDLAITFRHLVAPGKDVAVAHKAAIAAGVQGRFWEMHDQLVRNRAARSDAALEKLATAAGLDVAKWNADRVDPALDERITEDTIVCNELGLSALPSWKVGTEIVLGNQPVDRFTKIIDAALAPK